ncbi:MAG: alpha/beta fold hydrolase [Candidatus Brocadiae bacterium]|nr:alpha/beta fold hydrolase [Candidatus Brocadiia bacterium]
MQKTLLFAILFLFFVLTNAFSENGEQKFADLGNFLLENQECLENARIGYRIFGKPNPEKTNIVLYLTWFGGNSHSVSWLLGKGKIIDTEKYCVVVVDALGNAVSSSPSISKVSYDKFPRFTVRDMVNSQHALLTKHLGISHIYALIGGSMGGMQVFEWISSYPDFMDKAISYVGTPRLTSYDLLLFHTTRKNMEMLKKYGAAESDLIMSMRMLFSICMDSPENRIRQTSVKDFPAFFASLEKNTSSMNSDDHLAQLYAMLAHDISAPWGGAMEKVYPRIKAKVFIIVSKNDRIVNPKESMDFAKALNTRLLILENDLGHLAVGYELARVSKEIADFLAQP